MRKLWQFSNSIAQVSDIYRLSNATQILILLFSWNLLNSKIFKHLCLEIFISLKMDEDYNLKWIWRNLDSKENIIIFLQKYGIIHEQKFCLNKFYNELQISQNRKVKHFIIYVSMIPASRVSTEVSRYIYLYNYNIISSCNFDDLIIK